MTSMKVLLLVSALLLGAVVLTEAQCNQTAINFSPSDSFLNPPNVRLVFLGNRFYNQTRFFFVGAGTNCNSNVNTSMWSFTDFGGCNRSHIFNGDLNFVLSRCNFNRIEQLKSAFSVTYRTTVLAEAVWQSAILRGVAINTTLLTAMDLDLDFSDVLNTSANASITGGGGQGGTPQVFSAISLTRWDFTTNTLTLTLVTSMPWPYQLTYRNITRDATWTGYIVRAQNLGPNQLVNNASNVTAACFDDGGVSGCSGSDGTYNACLPCFQTWIIALTKTSSCPTATTLAASNWTVSFGILCHSLYAGTCIDPADPLSATSVAFDTNSGNFCPQLVDSTNANAALSVATQSLNPNGQASTTFVFGARSNFTFNVSSPILVARVILEQITVVSGGPTANLILYNNLLSAVGNVAANQLPCNTLTGGACTTGVFQSSFNLSPTLLQIQDTFSNSNTTCQFSLVWNSLVSSALSDAGVPTTIRVALRIRYADQSLSAKVHTMDLAVGSAAADVQVTVRASAPTTIPVADGPQTTASSASTVNATVIGAIAVAVGAVAAVTIAAVMVKRLKRSSRKSPQNVEMTRVDSAETTMDTQM